MNDSSDPLRTALADRYAIQAEIGAGGMATVYLAEDLKHNRKVAVKVLRPDLAAILGGARFLKEIAVTANLQHPHILPLHDSGEADSFLYYVMPFVEGESLRERLNREKQLPVDDAIHITTTVASALDYAHRHAVIHRDIKPENILLHDGQPVVADFGIALAVSVVGGTRLTGTGLSVGTPHYMSPEQAAGEQVLDGRSDEYSLACVTFEMLAGEPPFTGPTAQAITAQKLSQAAPDVSARRATVSRASASVLAKALAPIPADRFDTPARFAEALIRAHTPVPGGLSPTAAPGRVAGPAGIQPMWLGAVLAVVVLALVGLMSWQLFVRSGAVSTDVVRLTLPLPDSINVSQFVGSVFAISPDGRYLAYAGEGNSGERQLYLKRLDEEEATVVRDSRGALNPFFSPDGTQLVYFADERLKSVPVAGGPGSVLAEVPATVLFGADWGDDDRIVLSPGFRTGLVEVSARGGSLTELTAVDHARGELFHRHPEVLPGGRGVLYMQLGASQDGEIWFFDRGTGQRRLVTDGTAPRFVSTGHLVFMWGNTLMGARFDPDRGELVGAPAPLIDDIPLGGGGSARFAVSETGTLVYEPAPVNPGHRLLLIDRDGNAQPIDDKPSVYLLPRIAPGGRRLAVTVEDASGANIWLYDLTSGTPSQLTFGGGDGNPVWTPDGRRVTYTVGGDDTWWVPADGSAEPERIFEALGVVALGDWIPEGPTLVFDWNRAATQQDLYVYTEADGPVPLLVDSAAVESPAVSLDGSWLAYVSDDSGEREVYVTPFPGVGRRLPVTRGGGVHPRWSANGRELFYRSGRRLMALDVRADSSGLSFGTPSVVYEFATVLGRWITYYDPHPDGVHVVVVDPIPARRRPPVVVLNWFEELKAKVGN